MLLLTAGIGLISTSASGITPNPTPSLKSGDNQAAVATVTVGNPTVYGRNTVSAHKKN
jgi:hypothetical protein